MATAFSITRFWYLPDTTNTGQKSKETMWRQQEPPACTLRSSPATKSIGRFVGRTIMAMRIAHWSVTKKVNLATVPSVNVHADPNVMRRLLSGQDYGEPVKI